MNTQTLQNMKIRAEIKHIIAQRRKLQVETMWYPMLISSGFIVGIITLTKLFL